MLGDGWGRVRLFHLTKYENFPSRGTFAITPLYLLITSKNCFYLQIDMKYSMLFLLILTDQRFYVK